MKNSFYQYFLLHISLFFGALIFQNLATFFLLAALAGFMPRNRRSFGYYFLASLIGIFLALILNLPMADLNSRLSQLLGISPLPFWLLVSLASSITLSLTAKTVNALFTRRARKLSR